MTISYEEYVPGDYMKISLKTGKAIVLVQGNILRQLIHQYNPWGIKNSYNEDVTMAVKYDSRLYFNINLGYDSESDYSSSCHMLFSCPANGDGSPDDIIYEKDFTEYPDVKPYLTKDMDDI